LNKREKQLKKVIVTIGKRHGTHPLRFVEDACLFGIGIIIRRIKRTKMKKSSGEPRTVKSTE